MGLQEKGSEPEGITCNSAISTCAKDPCRRRLQFLAEMQQRALASKVINYTAVISAPEKGQKPEKVVALPAVQLIKRLAPNGTSYNALLSTCSCFCSLSHLASVVNFWDGPDG